MYKDYIRINNASQSDKMTERHLFYDERSIKEISISLFGECNMMCDFCIGNMRHGIKCPDTFDHVIRHVRTVVANTSKSKFNIILYGGELFHDGIKDSVFGRYEQLVKDIRQIVEDNNKVCDVLFSTNLVHKNTTRVVDLLHRCNIDTINCSFDLDQRFTRPALLARFLKNVDFYQQQGFKLSIGFILTKQNIEQFYSQGPLLKHFDNLYQKHTIYFDYYHPNNRDDSIVDEDEIGAFLCYLDKHYPNIATLQEFKKRIQSSNSGCSCPASFIIDDVLIEQCCDFKQVARKYASIKKCFECRYKTMCSHPCIRMMSNGSSCFVKIYYDYLFEK